MVSKGSYTGNTKWPTYCCAFLGVIALLLAGEAQGQEWVYVNTDNLVFRDRPQGKYHVFAILHAHFRLKVEPYDDVYKNDNKIKGNFYRVSFSYDNNGNHHYTGGWVEKKYVVADPLQVSSKYKGPASGDEISLIPYGGGNEGNPNKFNASQFPPPKYKGGEIQPKMPGRIYHTGARGGCYYVGRKGNKIYVSKSYCK